MLLNPVNAPAELQGRGHAISDQWQTLGWGACEMIDPPCAARLVLLQCECVNV